MAAREIGEYIGAGLAAARPAAPSLASGTAAYYYATDTGVFSVYSGGSWFDLSGAVAPTIVQETAAAVTLVSDGITLGASPTQYNLLVCMVISNAPPIANAANGWFLEFGDTSVPDAGILFKIVTSAAEPAFQDPCTNANSGIIGIWEVANVAGLQFGPIPDTVAVTASSVIQPATDLGAILQSGLILGAFGRNTADNPTGITGATAGPSASNGVDRAMAMFSQPVNRLDTPTITGTYAGSTSTRSVYTIVR